IGAVIPGLTTEAETSGQELAALIDTIRTHQTQAIFLGVDTDPTLAYRVADETGVELVSLYFGSLSAGTPADTYLNFMHFNVETITNALR
ncbi:MAG: metal ABC transporter substrate-binding protein, partial [Anaerolineales bacterium]|nr:metal ABC transporter substrate-binding protein [Anaerolineales bacterium]